MRTFGDKEAGFSVDQDVAARVVCARTWGFWRPELASLFSDAVVVECRAVGERVGLFIDVTRLLPQREEGQAAFGQLMIALRELPLMGVVVVVTSMIVKMQLLRIGKEQQVRDWHYFATEEEAMVIITRSKRE